jgi:ABC-2 type transport system permease protein
VGLKTADTEDAGRRTVVWESDHPVGFFNVVAGRWDVKRGAGTAVFYHPGHPYNVDEILGCLDASRKYYSQWFFPYPWKER